LLLTLSSLIATSSLVEMLVPAQPAATGHGGAVSFCPLHSLRSLSDEMNGEPHFLNFPHHKHTHTRPHTCLRRAGQVFPLVLRPGTRNSCARSLQA
jgi:hypothetical protein